jgi:predicted DNA-binding transcriptional regulator YafY
VAKDTLLQAHDLLRTLQAHRYGMTLEGIAETMCCSRRTAQRWVKFLLEEGWAEEAGADDRGRKRWKPTKEAENLTPMIVTDVELLAQCLAIQAAAPLVAGTELCDALYSVTRKVAAGLPSHSRHFGVEALAAFPPPPNAEVVRMREELLADLLEATVSHRVLDVVYRPMSRGQEPKQYKMQPLAVFPHNGMLYIAAIGGDGEGKRPFYYAVHRFEDVTLTKEVFKPPKGFDAREFVRKSFGTWDGPVLNVCVRFSARVAPLVCERRFHHTQQVAHLAGGGVEVRIQASGWPEIKTWVLGFGADAELLEPKERRKEISQELVAASARYSG